MTLKKVFFSSFSFKDLEISISLLFVIMFDICARKNLRYSLFYLLSWCEEVKRRSSSHNLHSSQKPEKVSFLSFLFMTIGPESQQIFNVAECEYCDLFLVSCVCHLLCYFCFDIMSKWKSTWAYCLTAHNNHENENNVKQWNIDDSLRDVCANIHNKSHKKIWHI